MEENNQNTKEENNLSNSETQSTRDRQNPQSGLHSGNTRLDGQSSAAVASSTNSSSTSSTGVTETDEGDSSWRPDNRGSAESRQKKPTGGESDLENAGSGQGGGL